MKKSALLAFSFSCTVEVLAAEPARMGEVRPECISAVRRIHPTAPVLVTADTHLPLTSDALFNWEPFAVAVGWTSAHRLNGAVAVGIVLIALTSAAAFVATTSHRSITPLSQNECIL